MLGCEIWCVVEIRCGCVQEDSSCVKISLFCKIDAPRYSSDIHDIIRTVSLMLVSDKESKGGERGVKEIIVRPKLP